MLALPGWLLEMEASFSFEDAMEFHQAHVELPVFAITVYLFFIFLAPEKIKQAYNLKVLMGVWNLALSIFSIIGATRLVPVLRLYLEEDGLVGSMCKHSANKLTQSSGLWMMFFIYSKFLELLDTVFLVLHKRPVIFLHWFHHLTVLLYCWLSYSQAASTGLWFASMNYCVHSVMYFYYFLMVFRPLRSLVRGVAPFITMFQILQMVVGISVSAIAAYKHLTEGPASCKVEPSNWKLGLAMYSSYFFLFASLFYAKFLKSPVKNVDTNLICNATDSAGMFRDSMSGIHGKPSKTARKKSEKSE